MMVRKIGLYILACLSSLTIISCNPLKINNLEGDFAGIIDFRGQHIHIILSVYENWLGNTSVKLTVPSQLMLENTADKCEHRKDSICVQFLNGLKAEFIGKLTAQTFDGTWHQSGVAIPLKLSRTDNSPKVNKYVQCAVEFAKRYSVNTNQVNWSTFEEKLSDSSLINPTFKDLSPVFKKILSVTNDVHGSLVIQGERIAIKPSYQNRITQELKVAAFGHNLNFESLVITDNIGYLRIPTTPENPDLNDSFMEEMQQNIVNLSRQGISNYIIDLRLNEGGNMFTLLAGLYPLLGDGQCGGFVGQQGTDGGTWMLKRGNFYLDDEKMTNGNQKFPIDLRLKKIALITGPVTSSAAEAAVIALKGMPNAKIIGEKTKGFITAVSGIELAEGVTFYVSTKFQRNRQGQIFLSGVNPDEEVIGGDNFADPNQDLKVIRAIEWFNE